MLIVFYTGVHEKSMLNSIQKVLYHLAYYI